LKHFLTFLPDAYLATKIPDMSGKNLTYGNPILAPEFERDFGKAFCRVWFVLCCMNEHL